MAAKEISLKLLVHKEKNQVVYAESGKDFVDVLFSFLTMPVGTIVRLVRNQSKIGGMSMLYDSVEDLDVQLLQTEACKNMLLHPKSTSEQHCKNLKVNIDDTKPTQYYMCSSSCLCDTRHLISTANKAKCRCGQVMNRNIAIKKSNVVRYKNEGVFVKGKMTFMISDDLVVSPASSTISLELLKKLGIIDATLLEERNVNVSAKEVLHLLKRLLLSQTPLTDLFLREEDTIDGADLDPKVIAFDSRDINQSQIKREIGSESKKMNGELILSKSYNHILYAEGAEEIADLLFGFLACPLGSIVKCLGGCTSSESKRMNVKLILSKSYDRVLYAEAGEEFADLLFSFLTFPLGSIVKCLGGCTSMRCVDNLYKSVEDLSFKDFIKSEECKGLLLEPKLAPYFGSENQLPHIEEQAPWQPTTDEVIGSSSHRKWTELSTTNPKCPDVVTELGGTYMAKQSMFMVTDELNVKPLSPILGMSLLNEYNICKINDLEERFVSVGEEEALSLLKASLISKTVLSDVFNRK